MKTLFSLGGWGVVFVVWLLFLWGLTFLCGVLFFPQVFFFFLLLGYSFSCEGDDSRIRNLGKDIS